MSRTSNQYVYILWDKEGTIEYVGKGQGKRIYESCREKKSFGGTIFKRNLSEQIALSILSEMVMLANGGSGGGTQTAPQ